MQIPFIGQAYESRSIPVANQSCINLYPETEPGMARAVITLQSVSGTATFSTVNSDESSTIRAMRFSELLQKLYVVTDKKLYEVSSDGSATELGNIGVGEVSMSDNGDEIVIVNGTTYYVWNGVGLQIVANGANATDVTFQDGYIIFTEGNSDRFRWSSVNDALTINALDFLSSNASPDILVGIAQVERRLWLFGTDSITIWYNGGGDPTWSLVDGGSSNGFGLSSPKGKVVQDSRIFWCSNDGRIYTNNGYTPQRVSTFGVENSLRKYGDLSDCEASEWSENGHKFISFSFPKNNATWVFDVAVGMWHQRASTPQGNKVWNAVDVTRAWNRNLVGSRTAGVVGELVVDTFQEYGDDMSARRVSPTIHANQNVLTHDRLELYFESGTTEFGTTTNTWSVAGSSFNVGGVDEPDITSLNSTDIAYIDATLETLRTYRFDGSVWVAVGNALSIPGISDPRISAMTATRIAFIDGTNSNLQAYDWDGTDWTVTGNAFNIAGIGSLNGLTALNSTEIAHIDQTVEDLQTYAFDGTNWSTVGNVLNIAGIGRPSIAGMTSTRIAFHDSALDVITAYDFDGVNWAKVGSSLSVPEDERTKITAMSDTLIAIVGTDSGTLQGYSFNGSTWASAGSGLAGVGSPGSNNVGLTALTETQIAFTQGSSDVVQAYNITTTTTFPKVSLRWSDDGGFNWGNWVPRKLGKIGEYRTRCVWYRLGQAQNRVYDMRITDNTPRTLIDVVLEAEAGEI